MGTGSWSDGDLGPEHLFQVSPSGYTIAWYLNLESKTFTYIISWRLIEKHPKESNEWFLDAKALDH